LRGQTLSARNEEHTIVVTPGAPLVITACARSAQQRFNVGDIVEEHSLVRGAAQPLARDAVDARIGLQPPHLVRVDDDVAHVLEAVERLLAFARADEGVESKA
jgi:hypothetical protein